MNELDRSPPRPAIFVSYSAKEPEIKALLKQIGLTCRNRFELYIAEEKMRLATPFRNELATQLLSCEGAIILLSPAALKSDEVRTEVEFLDNRRRALGDRFPFLPFLVAGANLEMLKKSPLDKLGLSTLHLPDATGDAATQIAAVLEQHCPARGDFYRLEIVVSELLAEGIHDRVLELAAESLDIDINSLIPSARHLAVARQMLSVELTRFEIVMGLFSPLLRDPIAIIERVLPFTWIAPEAVRPLIEAANPQGHRPAMAINSALSITGRWYVRRACPEPDCWAVAETVDPEHELFDAALALEVRRVIRELLKFRDGEIVSEAELADEVVHHERVRGPIFILLPAPSDHLTVTLLRDQFPTVIFLILAGSDTIEGHLPEGVILLAPLLDPATERRSLRAYERLISAPAEGRN
jgi:hypothetical protein